MNDLKSIKWLLNPTREYSLNKCKEDISETDAIAFSTTNTPDYHHSISAIK